MNITISTSSHPSTDDINKIAFDELNELLLSDKNPEQWVFQEEWLFLDNTRWFISIPASSSAYYENEDITLGTLENIVWFIKDNLSKDSQNIKIYIWNDIF